MLEVLVHCPFTPPIRTDCQALLTTAIAGTSCATHHDRPLARVWNMIAHATDGEVDVLVSSGNLVWMPAHKSHHAVGSALLSNGTVLSTTDWRANRLVDCLAKAAAKSLAAPREVSAFLRSADAAAAHAACLLGIVTHAANNFRAPMDTDGGGDVIRIIRDSVDRPRGTQPSEHARADSCPPGASVAAPGTTTTSSPPPPIAPWRAPTPQVHANRLHKSASERALVRRVEEIGAQLLPSRNKTSASERLNALAARIRGKARTLGTLGDG